MDATIVSSSGSRTKTTITRKSHRTRKFHQRFSDYIWFGFQSTACLAIFVGCYALVLLIIWPLLLVESPTPLSDERQPQGARNVRLPPVLKQVAEHDKEVISSMAGAIKNRLQKLRQGRGVTDTALLVQAKVEFEERRKQKHEAAKQAEADAERKNLEDVPAMAGNSQRQGFFVLGMHRSGTSLLSGMLHTSCGYNVGGPLIGSAFDNEKGFFERIDIVLQNDEFMRAQQIWWAANVINYDWQQALKDKEEGRIDFTKYGISGLGFLNNPNNSPWLQKDPRMCITLKTWLKLMNSEPAVVFTYRHPLEVAMSLKHRERNFSLERGLRLWIVYNMRGIQNSKGLCIVYSSNEAVLADPINEIQRISDELTTKCNVPEPPYRVKGEDVAKFIDPSLQHNKNKRAKDEQDKEIIATYNDGKCIVRAYESEEKEGTPSREREMILYNSAMKIYCDFQSGKAYEDDYEWPKLP